MTIPTKSSEPPEPADIAFIGLGIMGGAMAANLARAGHRVRLWNRTADRKGIAELVEVTQSQLAKSIAEAVAEAQYIFICVSDVPDLETVLFGENGVAKSARQGALVIDTSTTGQRAALDAARRLSERKVRFVDAPVTGGDVGARLGTLTILVGASPEDFAEIAPILHSIGKGIFHCGPVGSGQAVKLCNQILCAVNMVAVAKRSLSLANSGSIARSSSKLWQAAPAAHGR